MYKLEEAKRNPFPQSSNTNNNKYPPFYFLAAHSFVFTPSIQFTTTTTEQQQQLNGNNNTSTKSNNNTTSIDLSRNTLDHEHNIHTRQNIPFEACVDRNRARKLDRKRDPNHSISNTVSTLLLGLPRRLHGGSSAAPPRRRMAVLRRWRSSVSSPVKQKKGRKEGSLFCG